MAKNNAKQLISEYHDKVVSTGNFDLLNKYIAPDIILHTPYLPHALKGREKFKEFMSNVFSAVTRLKITTNEIVAEGNQVVVRWTLGGVSTNDFMNVPAGGDERIICIMSLYHLHDSKIIEVWAVDSSMWPKVYDF